MSNWISVKDKLTEFAEADTKGEDVFSHINYISAGAEGSINFPLNERQYLAMPMAPLHCGGYGTFEFSICDTESPIEAKLHYSLSSILLEKFTPSEVQVCGRIMPSGLPYRIDLTILGFDRRKPFITPLALIECDGKEFHSTSEQKEKDAHRESKIKEFFQDVPFFRFTGAQINADGGADECARTVLQAIFNSLMDIKSASGLAIQEETT